MDLNGEDTSCTNIFQGYSRLENRVRAVVVVESELQHIYMLVYTRFC